MQRNRWPKMLQQLRGYVILNKTLLLRSAETVLFYFLIRLYLYEIET